MLNVGIVGYGLGARVFHAPFIVATEGLNLRAVATKDLKRIGRLKDRPETENVTVYGSPSDLIHDPNIDFVVIASPNSTHFQLALEALEAGKHVVIDKPMTLSVAEARTLINRAKRLGRILTTYQNRRFDWDFQNIQWLKDTGRIGEIHFLRSTIGYNFQSSGWRTEMKEGGLLADWGAHLIDQAILLMGMPISWSYKILRPRGNEMEDIALCRLHYSEGKYAEIRVSSIEPFPLTQPRWHIIGSKAVVVRELGDFQEQSARVFRPLPLGEDPDPARVWDLAENKEVHIPFTPERGWQSFYIDLMKAARDEAPLPVDPQSVLQTIQLVEGAASERGVSRSIPWIWT